MQRSACHVAERAVGAAILLAIWFVLTSTTVAQDIDIADGAGASQAQTAVDPIPTPSAAPGEADLAPATAQVDVKPVSPDEDIRKRLQSVLDATDSAMPTWYTSSQRTQLMTRPRCAMQSCD